MKLCTFFFMLWNRISTLHQRSDGHCFKATIRQRTYDRDRRSWGISSSDGYASFYLFKYRSSRLKEAPLKFQEIWIFQTPFKCQFNFFVFLMHFRIQRPLEIKVWSKEREEITSWTSISSSKTRNEKPCIRRLIGSFRRLISVRLCVFVLTFHHLVLILPFES